MAKEQRLIDANELHESLRESLEELRKIRDGLASDVGKQICNGQIASFVEAILRVKDAPTVDAVEVKCKVGDLVYALWEAPVKQKYIIYCAEVKEIRISMRNCRLTTTYILEPIMYRGHRREYRDEDFGKLVFLSEEEAETTLTKMDGGNEDVE